MSPPDTVGLDVGSNSVRLVQLRKENGTYKVLAAGKKDISSDSDRPDKSSNMNQIQAILDCYESSGVQSRYAVCGVCGPEVAVRDFRFPMLPLEEVPSAVHLEAEQVCPFNIAESVVDYQLLPNDSDELKGILVAATNKVIRHKSKVVKDALLNPVLMDIDGLALCNCFSECEKNEQGKATAILNVGNMHTILVIVDSETMPFVRDISHAGSSIKKHLIEQLGVSSQEISSMLFSDDVPDDFDKRFEAACAPLIDDVAGTIRYYMTQKKSLSIDRVLVCGGFAMAKGFVDILARRLLTGVRLWNPFEKMDVEKGSEVDLFIQSYGCEMVVAAGLAMRSL
jgi:type IV pilus assembly protein PilM